MRAWRGLGRFEDRAGLRPWLYRIATNVCLGMPRVEAGARLSMDLAPVANGRSWHHSHELALGAPRAEATWVQPVPDHLVSSPDDDPAAVAVSRESIRLAFIASLQHLVPRQRAVLVLRDVLGWRAHEVAELLETSEDAVNSTLRRARRALEAANLDGPPIEPTGTDRALLYRYIEAFERYDVDSLVALLHEDATLSMPPSSYGCGAPPTSGASWSRWRGSRGAIGRSRSPANGCPALAVYRPAQPDQDVEPFAIHVLEVVAGRIVAIYAFLDPTLFRVFGLPTAPGLISE